MLPLRDLLLNACSLLSNPETNLKGAIESATTCLISEGDFTGIEAAGNYTHATARTGRHRSRRFIHILTSCLLSDGERNHDAQPGCVVGHSPIGRTTADAALNRRILGIPRAINVFPMEHLFTASALRQTGRSRKLTFFQECFSLPLGSATKV